MKRIGLSLNEVVHLYVMISFYHHLQKWITTKFIINSAIHSDEVVNL